ncbi:hypothetical protein C8R47DRAFT_808023 [Mycena vitilis]|nr:hypothetical protein C8R47DRAFT_808023 [Mycena vitilis]
MPRRACEEQQSLSSWIRTWNLVKLASLLTFSETKARSREQRASLVTGGVGRLASVKRVSANKSRSALTPGANIPDSNMFLSRQIPRAISGDAALSRTHGAKKKSEPELTNTRNIARLLCSPTIRAFNGLGGHPCALAHVRAQIPLHGFRFFPPQHCKPTNQKPTLLNIRALTAHPIMPWARDLYPGHGEAGNNGAHFALWSTPG